LSVLVLFGLILLALAVPDVCPQVLGLDGNAPDLWVATVIYIALRARGYRAVGWGIALGFIRDAVSLDPLGTHAFVLGVVAFLFCEGRRRRGPVKGASGLVATFAATLLAGWLYVFRVWPTGQPVMLADLWHAVPTALTTTLFALVLHGVLDRYHLLDGIRGPTRGLPA